jgi:osmoprotectant transport system ATP-binding protein
MDHGEIQQYDTPANILRHPANEFVAKLVRRERHTCFLSEDRVGGCEFSGAACGLRLPEGAAAAGYTGQ